MKPKKKPLKKLYMSKKSVSDKNIIKKGGLIFLSPKLVICKI